MKYIPINIQTKQVTITLDYNDLAPFGTKPLSEAMLNLNEPHYYVTNPLENKTKVIVLDWRSPGLAPSHYLKLIQINAPYCDYIPQLIMYNERLEYSTAI